MAVRSDLGIGIAQDFVHQQKDTVHKAIGMANLIEGAVNTVMNTVDNIKSLFADNKPDADKEYGLTLKSYLESLKLLGVQVKNNFEIEFVGIPGVTFFATNITVPGVHTNNAEFYYKGRKLTIPINYDFDLEFSMTLLNDASGIIYSTFVNFLISDSNNIMARSGYNMTVKVVNGDPNFKGTVYTLSGVRITNVGEVQYGYSDNDISTFQVNCSLIEVKSEPGAVNSTKNS